jgi:ABC-type Mn2+/Zn2+ transport system ATPase subunit
MFSFQKLEVVHWDFWERFSLPLDADVITVVGPNGSGKTTCAATSAPSPGCGRWSTTSAPTAAGAPFSP